MTAPTMRILALLVLAVLCASTHATPDVVATTATTASPSANSSSRCDEGLLFQKLYVLMPAINQCAKETDYFINTEQLALPSNATLSKFCTSANCTRLSTELDAAGLPSCTVAVGTNEVSLKDFFAQIRTQCTALTEKPSGGKSAAASQLHTLLWCTVFVAVVLAVSAVL